MFQVESNCPSKCDCNPYSWDMNQIDLDCHRAQLDTIPRNVPLTTAKADFRLVILFEKFINWRKIFKQMCKDLEYNTRSIIEESFLLA